MRARNLKPGFFKNEELCKLPYSHRLLFAGLWLLADREGRLEDRPERIKAEILPFDCRVRVSTWMNALADAGFLVRYAVANRRYIQILNFRKHQHPHQKEPPSTIPAPGEYETQHKIGMVPNTEPAPVRPGGNPISGNPITENPSTGQAPGFQDGNGGTRRLSVEDVKERLHQRYLEANADHHKETTLERYKRLKAQADKPAEP